jgi:hypothetical protein
MRLNVFSKPLSQANRGLLTICCCFLVITVLWLGVCLDNSATALVKLPEVSNVETFNGAIASRPNVLETLKDKVKDDLGEKADSVMDHPSFSNLGMEKLKSNKEPLNPSFDDSAKQMESTGNDVDERTEENVAKIQGKATDSEHRVENSIEDVMSSIKDKVN